MAAVIITDNSQVAPDTISGHKPPAGKQSNPGSVNGQDVANNGLTGSDIANDSGVDTCPYPATRKFGRICAGSDGHTSQWGAALSDCGALGVRVPTPSEAYAGRFWADGITTTGGGQAQASSWTRTPPCMAGTAGSTTTSSSA
jgi:hypothetical protein